MHITVGIPTYNRPREFRRALESVMAQRRAADTILVGDDDSSEEVHEIVASFCDKRILYAARRPRVRMTENWDFVTRWAPHGIVALLEDDNFWGPHHLENAENLFKKFPETAIYHASHQEAWDNNSCLTVYKTHFPPWHTQLAKLGGGVIDSKSVVLDALVGGSINSSTVVMSRAALALVPLFDGRYLMGMDTLMWTRLAMVGQCVYGPFLDTTYTDHATNVSRTEIAMRRAGRQGRAARRLIFKEALEKQVISVDDFAAFLRECSPPERTAALTAFASFDMPPEIRACVQAEWRADSLKFPSGFIRLANIVGFSALENADKIDEYLAAIVRFVHK